MARPFESTGHPISIGTSFWVNRMSYKQREVLLSQQDVLYNMLKGLSVNSKRRLVAYKKSRWLKKKTSCYLRGPPLIIGRPVNLKDAPMLIKPPVDSNRRLINRTSRWSIARSVDQKDVLLINKTSYGKIISMPA